MRERLARHPGLVAGIVLGLLAYLPALTASPGRMVADSKLYLYLDPGRFLADNLFTFDGRQFAGWVPHQHISYLWPAGPWYWLFDTVGVTDWLAHRLWIGTVVLAAGLGVRWAARLLGLSPVAALVGAILYQVSPYILSYVSRTSVMLLPFAGLGWIVGLTVVATRRRGWAAPAGIALVVLTVGSVNATALAMIVPGPLLWLVHAAWARVISVRRAVTIAVQTGVLCLGLSAWWIAMLMIQARHGVNVVAFSEALDDVALTSTAPEVMRALGYWLFYVRDSFGPTTTESLGYLTSSRYIVISYAVVIVGALGLVAVRWTHRRFAALLVGVGAVLAVGVHPTDDPAPLVGLLTGGGEAGLAEALRSSTRAIPLLALGLALGAAALVDASPRMRLVGAGRRLPVRTLGACAIAVLAVVNLPALWNGGFTDPMLDRDESPPDSWTSAAAALDARPDGYRVLQMPGAEFGAFRWGYTVDQPLPGLTERPLVTRDLLPLGSAAAMDLVFALDDRVQSGVLEPDSVAPIARLLGADTIWGANDAAFERFRTARPEIVQDLLGQSDGIRRGADFGAPTPNVPSRAMLDEADLVVDSVGRPMSDVTLWEVAAPLPVIRAAATAQYVSGSGDGLIDMAAGGLLHPDAVLRYTAALTADELDAAAASGADLVVTDSNRDRAHHWRSSQDVVGATESGGGGAGVLGEVVGDERLDIFGFGEEVPSSTQTVAVQDGSVRIAASGYGEPFAYRPEHRAVMAIDGDPDTAWTVADRADAVGHFVELTAAETVDHVVLRQPTPAPHARTITAVEVSVDDGAPMHVELGDESLSEQRQRIDLPPVDPEVPIRITVAATSIPERLTPEVLAAVGFAEIDVGLGPTTEWIRPPVDALGAGWDGGVATVLTRLRTDPLNRWRDDPEPALRRQLSVALLGGDAVDPARVQTTLRLHQRADDATLRRLLGLRTNNRRWAVASTRLPGTWSSWGFAAVDDDPLTAWRSPFGDAQGVRLRVRHGSDVVRSFRMRQPVGGSLITALQLEADEGPIDVAVAQPAPDGWSTVELSRPLDGPTLDITVTGVDEATTIDPRYGEITILPVGIAEIEIAGADPPVELPTEITGDCRDDLLAVDGRPVGLSYTVPTERLLAGEGFAATLCSPLEAEGDVVHVASTAGAETGLDVDRITLLPVSSNPTASRPTATVIEQSRLTRSIAIDSCPEGCWLVVGEGWNPAWAATLDGEALGDPVLIDGGFNGWWLNGGDDGRQVEVVWTAQGALNWAFVITIVTLLLALALVLVGVRSRSARPRPRSQFGFELLADSVSPRETIVAVLCWVAASALLVDWTWGIVAALCSTVVLWQRRPALLTLAGWSGMLAVGVAMVVLQRVRHPYPNGGWPGDFGELHEITLFAVVTLVVGSVAGTCSPGRGSPTIGPP